MRKTTEEGLETESTGQQAEVTMKEVSRDVDNGIVVFKTNAENGTGFTLLIDQDKVRATAKDGQVWFYAERPLGETPNIRLA